MRKHELVLRLAAAEAELARIKAQDAPAAHKPNSAAAIIRRLCPAEQEVFVVILQDPRQRIIKATTVALGSVDEVSVYPREVFRDAVRAAASTIVLGHNHPTGIAEPSNADYELTGRLVQAGKILGIPVVDHLIVTPIRYYSFAEHGLISNVIR